MNRSLLVSAGIAVLAGSPVALPSDYVVQPAQADASNQLTLGDQRTTHEMGPSRWATETEPPAS